MTETAGASDQASRCFRGCCTSTSVQLDVPMSEIKLEEHGEGGGVVEIAKGAMSSVKKGWYLGQEVAVKFPSLPTRDDLDRFHKELSLHLEFTADSNHRHIVPVVGARAYPPGYITIMPLASGDLQQAIHSSTPEQQQQQGTATAAKKKLHLSSAISLGLEIARGVQALHQRGYVHRDLKPANVLLTKDGVAQLTDFQLTEKEDVLVDLFTNAESRLSKVAGKPSGGFHKRLLVGTLEYMAPEILTKDGCTRKSDVYSFAILLNEVLTGIFPFSDCHKERPGCHTVLELGYGHQELKAAVASEGLRPTLLDSHGGVLVEGLNRLLETCWAIDPSKRPSIDGVCEDLEALLKSSECRGGGDTSPFSWTMPRGNDVVGNGTTKAAEALGDMMEAEEVSLDVQQDALRNLFFSRGKKTPVYNDSRMEIGSFQTIGGRESQEDRVVSSSPFCDMEGCHLLAVFDGHRGSEASDHCAKYLESAFKRLVCAISSAEEALLETFDHLDASFREQHEGCDAGATALVALVCGSKLFVANCGDCRCILGGSNGVTQLSQDHTTTSERERDRILASGGQVKFQFDTWRVGSVGLQVTRSIGDADVKALGVTSRPEIVEYDLREGDEFLVLASDGLWDVMSNEEVVGLIHDTVKNPSMAGQRLAGEAFTRGSRDNVSVLICFLDNSVGTCERIYSNAAGEKHKYSSTHWGTR